LVSLSFIMGFIGASVALIIGILIFSEVSNAIECPDFEFDQIAYEACNSAKDTAWIIIGIVPIAMFFVLFSIFGGFGSGSEYESPRSTTYDEMLSNSKRKRTLKEKRAESKEKQRLADEKMFGKHSHNDLVQHSFLTKWLRK